MRVCRGARGHCTRIGLWYVPSMSPWVPSSRFDTSRLIERRMRKKRAAGTASVRASSFSTTDPRRPKRVETLVEHPDEVVLGVAERLGRDGARVGEHVAPLFGDEAQRVAEHLRQVVVHQQRFVLVHRQRRVTFGRIEDDPEASLRDASARHEVRELIADAEARILQVDRIDRMRRDGHQDARLLDGLLLAETDEAREPPSRPAVNHPVEIHEADRFTWPVRVRHARPQSAGDEREVRIRVPRLDRALLASRSSRRSSWSCS